MAESEIVVRVDADLSMFKTKMAETTNIMKITEASALAMNTTINAVKFSTLTGIGAMAALVAPTIIATKVLEDFDDNMRRLGAIGGEEFKSNIDEITKTVNRFAIDFGAKSEEITDILITFAKAGFTYNETMKMLEPTMQLAIANQADLATSAELAMYAFTLWGRKSGMQTYEMLDKMHRAASLSILDIEDLQHAFEMAGSAASIANVSYEEFLALAGGLSMVAAEAGSTVGTLLTHLIAEGDKFERALGVEGIWNEGKINLMNLVDAMQSGIITADAWQEAWGLWGVRSAKPLMQMKNAAAEISTIYKELTGGQDLLASGVDEMSVSFNRLFRSMIESLEAGLRTKENMDIMRSALQSLQDTLASSTVSQSIANIIAVTAKFLVDNADKFITMIENLITITMKLYPTIYAIGEMFINLGNIISRIPEGFVKLIALFMITNKILPVTRTLTKILNGEILEFNKAKEAQRIAMEAGLVTDAKYTISLQRMIGGLNGAIIGLSMFGIGFATLSTATSKFDLVLGGLLVTLGAFITALTVLSMLQTYVTALTTPWKVGIALGVAAGAGIGLTAMAVSNKERMNDVITTSTTNYGNTNYNEYNIYDIDNSELEEDILYGGTLGGY